MKTELDFSRVPLDKWVDLYVAVQEYPMDFVIGLSKPWSDIRKFAEVQVKEASDYDKELADACIAWFANTGDVDAHSKLMDLIYARQKASGVKEDKEIKDSHLTEAEPFIPIK